MRHEHLIIACDFDGTLVRDRNPEIGPATEGSYWIHRCQREAGARVILWTARGGEMLAQAVEWCQAHQIGLYGINANPLRNHGSPKVLADVFVDDRALGTPLVQEPGHRPYVDWSILGPRLLNMAMTYRRDAERKG